MGDEIKSMSADDLAAFANMLNHSDFDGDAVPVTHLAERLGIERKQVYRYIESVT